MEGEDVGITMDKLHDTNTSTEGVDEIRAPTDEERQSLRRVPGTVPWVSWVICTAELAERGSYYAASQVFNNFMQFPLPKGGNGAGAVAKDDPNGHSGAL